MKNYKTLSITVLLLMLMSTGLYALDRTPDPAALEGSKTTLTGILVRDANRWTLQSEGTYYEIRFGNRRFLDSIDMPLEDGAEVSIYGTLGDKSITPLIVVMYPEAFFLRHTDGRPLWAANNSVEQE